MIELGYFDQMALDGAWIINQAIYRKSDLFNNKIDLRKSFMIVQYTIYVVLSIMMNNI